ncbi:MAG: universal stress protein [Acidobacteriota bacterium]
MSGGIIREIVLHGGTDERFDHSVGLTRQLIETFHARLHVVYTVEDPLGAGWTAEISPERLPELHQAMQDEARERLSRLISLEGQEHLGIEIVILIGTADVELVRYVNENAIDLAVVHAHTAESTGTDVAGALLEHGRCAVLVLR